MITKFDPKSRDELIYGHLRLIMKLVSIFSNWSPRKKHDILSVALIALIETVDNREKIKNTNLGAVINKNVQWAIRQFLCEDHVIKIPATSYYRKKHRDGLRDPVSIHGANKISSDYDQEGSAFKSDYDLRLADRHGTISSELKEILNQLPRSDIERQVLILRMQGYRDKEIAERLGCSKVWVGKIRNELEERFNQLWE